MDGRGHLPQVPSSPSFCPCSELWQDPPGQTPWTGAQQLWKENRGTLQETPPGHHQHPELQDPSNPQRHALTLNFSFTSRSSESSSNSF